MQRFEIEPVRRPFAGELPSEIANIGVVLKDNLHGLKNVFPDRESADAEIERRGGNYELPTADVLPDGEYAIAELLGHSTMVGRYAEVERFGTKMLQLEPIWNNALLAPVLIGGGSLYRFTLCSKQVAFDQQPGSAYSLPDAVRATLPAETNKALPAPVLDGTDYGRTSSIAAEEDEDEEFREVDE